jgi:methylphosphotriester-DNA--protein-cysteine methyltransferase
MPATPTVNPTKAALEAAVLDLTDAEIAEALRKADGEVRRTYKEREAYTWPREAQRTLLEALARRLAEGRRPL